MKIRSSNRDKKCLYNFEQAKISSQTCYLEKGKKLSEIKTNCNKFSHYCQTLKKKMLATKEPVLICNRNCLRAVGLNSVTS